MDGMEQSRAVGIVLVAIQCSFMSLFVLIVLWEALGIFDRFTILSFNVGDLALNFEVFVLGALHLELIIRACSIQLLVIEIGEVQDEILWLGGWLANPFVWF